MAAGYAPAYRESSLDDRYMASVRSALDTMLAAHEPYPAVVVDRCWNVVTGNRAMSLYTDVIPPHVREPVPNMFRMALHPDGLAPHISNFGEVRALFLGRLRRQVDAASDAQLRALHEEVSRYRLPGGEEAGAEPVVPAAGPSPIQVPLRIRTALGELSMFTTMATFGAPADVTLSELAIELGYPLDEFTKNAFYELSAGSVADG